MPADVNTLHVVTYIKSRVIHDVQLLTLENFLNKHLPATKKRLVEISAPTRSNYEYESYTR